MLRNHVEIERRFLVHVVSPIESSNKRVVEQHYLTVGDPEIRVTHSKPEFNTPGKTYTRLTIKTGAGLVRNEINVDLLPAQYNQFVTDSIGWVFKIRTFLDKWEIDEYGGKLSGLAVMEIELDTADDSIPVFPSCVDVIAEVTGISRYSNGQLSLLNPDQARKLILEVARMESQHETAI